MTKTFVVGDIHGCHNELRRLLLKVSPHPQRDTFIFLGDYIDRGPNSKEVLDTLIELKKNHNRLITLKGNHEEAFLDFISGKNKDFFLRIGGVQTLRSYGISELADPYSIKNIPAEHIHFLSNLLPFWENEEYIFVHAGLEPGVHLSQQKAEWLYWADKESFINTDYDFGKRVIFGHSASTEPIIRPNKIGIDCGAVYGGKLTCLVLPDLEFISVDAEKQF
jgi:serine/threonine protein phosphatase 1